MCHTKSRCTKCYEFNLATGMLASPGDIFVVDPEDRNRGTIKLRMDEMLGIIEDVKNGKWDEYYNKYLKIMEKQNEEEKVLA